MINHKLYEQDISTLLRPPTNDTIHCVYTYTAEKSLLVSVMHMMLGLPSDVFPMAGKQFRVDRDFPGLQHLSRKIMASELQTLVEYGNQLQMIRLAVRNLQTVP